MKPLQEKFERTFCKCGECKAACRTMPGNLIPGDLERIQEHLGIVPDVEGNLMPAFLANFQASEGAIIKRNGEYVRVPTIVPMQKPDGRCVFLSSKDECTIHPVAPFGCSRFNVCDDSEPRRFEDKRRLNAMINNIMGHVGYMLWWAWLSTHRPPAKPLAERKKALLEELDKVKDESKKAESNKADKKGKE